MTDLETKSIIKFLTAVAVNIKRTQEEKNIIASGKSAASLVVDQDSLTLTGSGSFYFQDKGRAPGKMPPIKSIEEWIAIKGVQANAWAIAKSIAKKGTIIFRDNKKGLQIYSIVEREKKIFLKDFAKIISQEILTAIRKTKIQFK